MVLKDTFKSIFNYFEVDDAHEMEDQHEEHQQENKEPRMRVAPASIVNGEKQPEMKRAVSRSQQGERTPVQRLNDRQNELLLSHSENEHKAVIDIKFPKRYEDATEIVNLLLGSASVLIDFQFMSETQARRCLDYIDGARSVLSGSMKKVSNTMWLLTPVHVTVNSEEIRAGKSSVEVEEQYNFDVRR